MHRTLFIPSLALALLASAAPRSAQGPPRQPPSFRTGVDLLTVEAAVFDKDGRPVADLQPGEFSVTIDGQPRKVLFSRFQGAERRQSATAVTDATGAPLVAAHLGNVASTGGQVVLFVVDRDTIRTGGERAMLDAAGSLIGALSPADAIGLKGLPVGGVELTREHQRVLDALPQMTGTMPPVSWRWHITWDEALGIERQDKQLLAQVLYRECRPAIQRAPELPPDVLEHCDRNVVAQASEMLLMARTQARATLANLTALTQRMAPLRGPKHVVLLSGGLRFEQGLLSEFSDYARQAAAAGVMLHVIHADQPDTDAATERRTITSPFGSREMSQGLTTIAGMTGGGFYTGVGSAAGVFERIATEMTNLYELGLESSTADADGRPRDLEISVNRPGVSVRARASVVVPVPAQPAPDPIVAALQQPTDVAEIPLAVTAYSTRGDDANLLRVLVSADVELPQGTEAGEWAFTVLNEGNPVASGRRKMDPGTSGAWGIVASAKLAPGKYRLRFAARASDGRTGVVDAPLIVGLRAAGDLQMSDLIIGTAEGDRLQPRGRVRAGSDMRALFEVLTPNPEQLAATRVALEIVPAGSAEPVQRLLMAARSTVASAVLTNEAQISMATLAPGRYTASAIALVNSEPVGRVSRVFEVVRN